MESSTSSELQQLSGYSAACIVDILRIVVAVMRIGISLDERLTLIRSAKELLKAPP
jgi:hypothetical protein